MLFQAREYERISTDYGHALDNFSLQALLQLSFHSWLIFSDPLILFDVLYDVIMCSKPKVNIEKRGI